MFIQHTQTSAITPPAPTSSIRGGAGHMSYLSREKDRGWQTVPNLTCGGTGDMDCVPFACEEVDADELPHDDLDGLGDTETGSAEVSVPCPCCGKQITITIKPEQVH